ncbi:urease accessory protein UreJ [Corticibacter populi]|uniref:Urease accessory protein UreJ n=1 Tax=Corticibacter populi TaxID=1550736 RepID=A0A3M6R0H4_9BURK|nr:HupE/UreJ family protein [Corticibacter populi]RMX08705.1 urease accessory protein UreJ [Corticibacter populi]RZS36054.1 urease accessory protein [Corticibacter populi]
MKRLAQLLVPATLALLAAPVLAHSGHDHHHALQDGLLHPATGLDHLLMLLGTGILAALSGRRLALPLATLAAMLVGAIAGRQLGAFIGMETLIAGSLVVAGIALLLPRRQSVLAALMPLLALAHGWAHGVEAAPAGFWPFTLGFVAASAALLAAGYGAGLLLRRHQRVRQFAGGGLLAFAAAALAG